MDENDRQLRDRVAEELRWEPSIAPDGILVDVDDGVVTLSGHVQTYAEKTAAEAAAKRVRGVDAVIQSIEVRPAQRDWDEAIARRARTVLDWDARLPLGAVRVKAHRGALILSGLVQWEYQRRAAEDAVRRLCGVLDVRNDIELRPGGQPRDVRRLIEQALARNAELDARRIRVAVADGTVTLEGEVKALFERDIAEQTAWSAPGVRQVEDHLAVCD